MEVILLEDVKSLGKKGQIVKINDGYARNFVLPKKLGLEATPKNLNDLKLQKAREAKEAAEELQAAKELAVKVEEKPVRLTMKTGEGGKTFGTISTKEVAAAAKEQLGLDIDKKKMEEMEIPPFLSDEFKNVLLQSQIDAITAKVVYEKFETDLLQEESTGVQKLVALLCPLLDIMINGKVLIYDELEMGLHEALVYELVKLFINTNLDSFSQILFTTHETGLLNLDIFRRDQIWFTEMRGIDRSTDLYSLAEIKKVRKQDNFGKGYIAGKYGAIPMLNMNFAKVISELE